MERRLKKEALAQLGNASDEELDEAYARLTGGKGDAPTTSTKRDTGSSYTLIDDDDTPPGGTGLVASDVFSDSYDEHATPEDLPPSATRQTVDQSPAEQQSTNQPTEREPFEPNNPDPPEAISSSGPDGGGGDATTASASATGDGDRASNGGDADDPYGDYDDDPDPVATKPRTWKDKLTDTWGNLTKTQRYAAISAAIVAVACIIGMIAMSVGGKNDTTPTAPSGGHVVDDEQDTPPAQDMPSGEPEPIPVTEISQVNAKCGPKSNDARLAFSTQEDEAWVCTRAHSLDGSILNIRFKQPVTVHAVEFTPGYNYVAQPSGDDYWQDHRVTTDVLWRLGGKQVHQQLTPARTPARFEFESPITTSAMSMTIQKTVPPGEAEVGGTDADQVDPFADSTESDGGELKDASAIQELKIIGVPSGN